MKDFQQLFTLKLGIVERAGEETYQHGVRNETGNTVNVSQGISSTHQYSISNSVTNAESHTVSTTKKIVRQTTGDIIKGGLDKLLGLILEKEDFHFFVDPDEDKTETNTKTDTFTKTTGTTKTTSNSVTVNDTVSITLPPHTEASIKQTNYTKNPTLKYDYPVTISFDVQSFCLCQRYEPKYKRYHSFLLSRFIKIISCAMDRLRHKG